MKYAVKLEARYSIWKEIEANSEEEALEKGESTLEKECSPFWDGDCDFCCATEAKPYKE